jgi:hypothetical protein
VGKRIEITVQSVEVTGVVELTPVAEARGEPRGSTAILGSAPASFELPKHITDLHLAQSLGEVHKLQEASNDERTAVSE